MNARWEHFSHQADIGVRGFAPSKVGAFEQAAMALTAVITDPETIGHVQAVEVSCTAPDDELLLVDWLNALVYEMATRRMLFGKFEVQIDGHALRGRAWGEKVNSARHQPAVEVKGATYTGLVVREDANDGWVAQCVVDV